MMCVNDVVMHFPGPVKHFFTLDHAMLPKWVAARRPRLRKEFGGPKYSHTCNFNLLGVYNWDLPGHGTSSLNAVLCGLKMGYDKIVICGVPLDNGPHYFSPPWEVNNFENQTQDRDGLPRYWGIHLEKFKDRVFSMSGRTRDFLGEP